MIFVVTVIIGRKEIKLIAEENVLISPAIAKSTNCSTSKAIVWSFRPK